MGMWRRIPISFSHAKQARHHERGLLEFINGGLGHCQCGCLHLGFIVRLRRFAWVLIAFALVFGSFQQIKPAQAFGPLLVPFLIGLTSISTMGAIAACEMTECYEPSQAVGQTVLQVTLQPVDSSGDGSTVRVPLSDKPASEPAAPNAPGTATQIPAASHTVQGGYYAGITYDSLAICEVEACADAIRNCLGWGNTNCSCPSYALCGAVTITVYDPASCPSGYTASGDTCALSSPRAAVSDKNKDYVRSGGSLSPASGDVDKSKVPVAATSNGGVQASGSDKQGNPVIVKVTPTPDGGSNVSVDTQKTDGAGVTYVNNKTYNINNNNVITGATSSTTSGSINYDSATGQNTVTGSGASVSTTVKFPDDYARQSTLQQVATNTGKISDALTKSAEGVVDPVIPGSARFNDSFFKGTFTNLLGWRLPSHSSECPSSSFQAFGKTFFMNGHCQFASDHMAAFRNAMVVVFVINALFIVLRA